LYSNPEALGHYAAATEFAGADEDSAQRIAEKSGDIALRLGRVEPAIAAWEGCLAYQAGRGEDVHVAELHRKIGAAFAHKGDRKRAIEHHQQGINLIKDREPSLTLVRLYEDAAWLYVQVGDNMLAIYAAEKALRLAEALGEARAASRAHGIFGRVFGRIGDAAKARENPSAPWRSRASPTRPRRSSRCRRSGTTSSTPRATTRRRGRATAR